MVHPFRGHGHAGGDLNVNFSDQASSMRIEPIRAFDGGTVDFVHIMLFNA